MSADDRGDTPKKVIGQIRRDEYLLDVDASTEIKLGIRNLHRTLNRALKLLSEDLYSKHTHFVLELVQNADDNHYPDNRVPRLAFQLKPDCLVVVNNEIGFSEENVRALCSVGRSSKAKKKGYIGEKGIGFKSVFTVSDAPEIHSNGYHFRFDRTDGESLLGYVVPQWHEPVDKVDDSATTIILPARSGTPFETSILEELDAKLLLFLGKIRDMELRSDDNVHLYSRRDMRRFTVLTSKIARGGADPEEKETRYVRVTHTVSMADLQEEKRPDIDSADVILAFPVNSRGKAEPDRDSLTFAFLPIRKFGFRFCIQSDFLLSSNREDIHTESLWNRRLRDSIAAAFIQAVDEIKESRPLSLSYLNFLPAEGEINESFFKPVVGQIKNRLGSIKCIPSASGEWRKPSEILLAKSEFKDLFDSVDVRALFGWDYADPRIEVDDEVLKAVGAHFLTYADLVYLFRDHGSWIAQKGGEWHARFYAYLSGLNAKGLVDAGIRSVSCIPTSEGKMAVPSAGTIFFPLNSNKRYGFESELTIIQSEILDQEAQIRANIIDFFVALGVKKDSPYDLVKSYVLLRHAGEAWKLSEHKALIGHLRYIKDKFQDYLAEAKVNGQPEESAIQTLRTGLWIGTKKKDNGSWTFNKATNVYVSKEYQPPFCIESLAGGAIPPQLLVSDEYLPPKTRKAEPDDLDAELKSWRSFLGRLGVNDAPKLTKFDDGDYKCSDEMAALMNSPKSSVRRALVECLDRHWPKYAPCLQYVGRSGRSSVYKDTCFVLSLRTMPAPTRKRASVSMSEAYLLTDEIKSIFGDDANYVDAQIGAQGLITASGVTAHVDAKACIKRLQQLKSDGGDTGPQAKRIYRRLEDLWKNDFGHIKSAFETYGLIRVKSGDRVVWKAPKDVSWRSSGAFLDSLYPPLEGQYKDFTQFFIDRLGVLREVTVANAVAGLSHLDQIESEGDRRKEAFQIYRRASRELAPKFGQTSSDEPDWLDTFKHEDVLLNHRGTLQSLGDDFFVDDMPELGRLFSNEGDFAFLAVSFDEIPQVRRLLEAIEAQFLSASIKKHVIENQDGVSLGWMTAKLRDRLRHIARMFYHRNTAGYETARDEGAFGRLRDLEIMEVPDLQLRVTLGEVERIVPGEIAISTGRLVIKQGTASILSRVAIQICNILGANESLSDAIELLLSKDDAQAADDWLSTKGIGRLPPEEEARLVSTLRPKPTTPADDSESPDGGAEAEGSSASSTGQAGDDDNDVPNALRNDPNSIPGSPSMDGVPTGSSHVPSPAVVTPADTNKQDPKPKDSTYPRNPAVPENGTTSGGEHDPHDRPVVRSGLAGNGKPHPDPADGPSEEPEQGGDSPRNGTHGGTPAPLASQDRKPRTGQRRNELRTQPRRTKSGRLLSYADAPGSESEFRETGGDGEQAAARDQIERAAVQFVMESQKSRWASLDEMPPNNPGFDIEATTEDGQVEYIEVKGQSGAWTETGVALTPTELLKAHREKEAYWLCVVEFATDPDRRQLHLVNNPFGSTHQFRFDSGWRAIAESESTKPLKPEPGLGIDIPDVGRGTIISVQKKGQFHKMHVRLSSGTEIFKQFNPASMKLSRD